MDPTVSIPIPKIFDFYLDRGVLGVSLLVAAVVIIILWRENKGERKKCSDLQAEIIKVAQEVVRTNIDVARTQEERNRQIGELAHVNSRLGLAIEHLGSISEIQHDQLMATLREIKAK